MLQTYLIRIPGGHYLRLLRVSQFMESPVFLACIGTMNWRSHKSAYGRARRSARAAKHSAKRAVRRAGSARPTNLSPVRLVTCSSLVLCVLLPWRLCVSSFRQSAKRTVSLVTSAPTNQSAMAGPRGSHGREVARAYRAEIYGGSIFDQPSVF